MRQAVGVVPLAAMAELEEKVRMVCPILIMQKMVHMELLVLAMAPMVEMVSLVLMAR